MIEFNQFLNSLSRDNNINILEAIQEGYTALFENEEQNFKNWFKNSKVVDSQGNPLVVYHGTSKKFKKFNKKHSAQGVFWFSENKDKIIKGESGASSSQELMPVYLSIQNMAGWKEYEPLGLGEIQSRGFDGIKLDDDYIVFEPQQIKSVNNKGTFSPTSNNIMESITAYHGSGQDFTKFMMDKVGTGEGLQKFGYGLYFTGSPKVAKHYAEESISKDKTIYQVSLNSNHNPQYINWHHPIEPNIAQDIVEQAREDNWEESDIEGLLDAFGMSDMYRDQPESADSIYGLISSILGGDKQASEFLLKAGVDGIVFKSGTLSGIDDSDFNNYVVFDQDDIMVKKKLN